MANVKFDSFTPITDPNNISNSDYLIGYKTNTSGGERRTTVDALSSKLTMGTMYPQNVRVSNVLYTNNINSNVTNSDIKIKVDGTNNIVQYVSDNCGVVQKNNSLYSSRVNTNFEEILSTYGTAGTADGNVTINLLDMVPNYWGNNMYNTYWGNALNIRVVVNIIRTNNNTNVVTPYNGAYQGDISFDTYTNANGHTGWTANGTTNVNIATVMGQAMNASLVPSGQFVTVATTRETTNADGTVGLIVRNTPNVSGLSTTTSIAVYLDLLVA